MLKQKEDSSHQEKTDWVIISLVGLSIILIAVAFFSPQILTHILKEYKDTGPIGDTIGGLTAPFIALAGVFVTFLAFYMQLKANKIQVELFRKNQDEQTNLLKEQVFFRLVDSLNQRIINFKHIEKTDLGTNEYSSYRALAFLVQKFHLTLDEKCAYLGRHLLALTPEKIDFVHYVKLLQAAGNSLPSPDEADELKKKIIAKKDYNERWEFIKNIVGSTDSKDYLKKEALKSIGRANFYLVDFKEREQMYSNAYDDLYWHFGGFLDGYTKTVSYLIDFIVKSNNDFFSEYLGNNLSSQESILIFYFCASSKSNERTRLKIYESSLLDGILESTNSFIDAPNREVLKNEIRLISDKKDVKFH